MAGITVTISTFTLAAVSVWFLLALIPPLIWTVGIWRAGTDADSTGLRSVRSWANAGSPGRMWRRWWWPPTGGW